MYLIECIQRKSIFHVLNSKLAPNPLSIQSEWPSFDDEIEVNGKTYVKVKFQLVELFHESIEKQNHHLKASIKKLESDFQNKIKEFSSLQSKVDALQILNIHLMKELEIEIKKRKAENQERNLNLEKVNDYLIHLHAISEIEFSNSIDRLLEENMKLHQEVKNLKNSIIETNQLKIQNTTQSNIISKQANTILRITKHVMRH